MKKTVAAAALTAGFAFIAAPAMADVPNTCHIVVVHIPAETKTVTVPAVYGPVEYEFVFKNDKNPNSPRWETDPNWNAESNEHSSGWHATGNSRPGALTSAAHDEVVVIAPAWDKNVEACMPGQDVPPEISPDPLPPADVPPVVTTDPLPVDPPAAEDPKGCADTDSDPKGCIPYPDDDCPPVAVTPPADDCPPVVVPPVDVPPVVTPPAEVPPAKGHEGEGPVVVPPHAEPGPVAPAAEAPVVAVPEAAAPAAPAVVPAAAVAPVAAPAAGRGVNIQTGAEAPAEQLAYTGAADWALPAGSALLAAGIVVLAASRIRARKA